MWNLDVVTLVKFGKTLLVKSFWCFCIKVPMEYVKPKTQINILLSHYSFYPSELNRCPFLWVLEKSGGRVICVPFSKAGGHASSPLTVDSCGFATILLVYKSKVKMMLFYHLSETVAFGCSTWSSSEVYVTYWFCWSWEDHAYPLKRSHVTSVINGSC